MHDLTYLPPIPFDKVMESRSISSKTSPLFKLPLEIINNIGSKLPTSKIDLASLALVNTDCRQLARSCQFRIVTLDGSRSSEDLLRLLHREAIKRGRNQGFTRSLSLGACVRYLITNNNGFRKEVIASRPLNRGRLIDDDFDYRFIDDQEWIAQLQPTERELEKRYNETYRPNVLSLLSSLVNLESLYIGKADWNQTLINTLVALPIKYLWLDNAQMNDVIPMMDIPEWPLERLTIYLNWNFDFIKNLETPSVNSSKSWEVAFRSCAPYLRILKISRSWSHGLYYDEELISFDLKFPQLRQLDLLWELNFSLSALRSLVLTSPYLTYLTIHYGDDDTRNLLDKEGHIESLKTLILNHDTFDGVDYASFDFLRINSQLEGLGFDSIETQPLLEHVLRILREFDHLKMLSMTWDTMNIPESSLEELACLKGIEKLHISTGIQCGWRHDWYINHNTKLEKLRSLKRLKRLAFTRDTYSYTQNGITTEYNSYGEIRLHAWNLHSHHMHKNALLYANAFPSLELLHIGKITFEIIRVEKDVKLTGNYDERFSWQTEILNMYP